jgi:hypothetical protein
MNEWQVAGFEEFQKHCQSSCSVQLAGRGSRVWLRQALGDFYQLANPEQHATHLGSGSLSIQEQYEFSRFQYRKLKNSTTGPSMLIF